MNMAQAPSDNDNLPWLDLGTYSSFLAYQAPLPVSWVAALHGRAAGPLTDGFTYLELGSGQGLALAALADSYPAARFIGIEPDADLAQRASALLRDAGLANAEIHHTSPDMAGALALPPCDVATISGLYSWYAKPARAALVRMLAEKLKPGGLLCVQYSALPGNAPWDSIAHLMKALAEAQEGDERQRLGNAMGRTLELARAGALYFQQVPPAAQALARLPTSDARLAMREILHGEGRSLSHIEVVEEMSACGLSYAGNGQIERNAMELVVPPALRGLMEGVKSEPARELMADFAVNASARIDIFAKPAGGAPREPAEALAPFLLARFAQGEETLLRQQLAQRTGVDFTAGLYDDLLRLIGSTPMSVEEVLDHAELRRHARARILRALQFLIGLQLVQLVRTRMALARPPLPEKLKLSSRLNALILERWLARQDISPFSSQVTGLRVTIAPRDRLRLHVLLGGALEPVLDKITASGVALSDNENKPITKEGFRDLITADIPQYRSREAGVLFTLGVLVPA
jgi:SAM-dependent methyltransferase